MQERIREDWAGGFYLVDILDPSNIPEIKKEAGKNLNIDLKINSADIQAHSQRLKYVLDKYQSQIEFVEEPYLVVAKQRTNMRIYPIPWRDYKYSP